ncbi:MAG: biotin-independent malonate decarboxylase subunit beta, partial [Sulfuricella sp.]
MTDRRISYFEASARMRLSGLVDADSFSEFCPPEMRQTSPHLAQLGAPQAFDDGVIVGRATLAGHAVLIAAQEG